MKYFKILFILSVATQLWFIILQCLGVIHLSWKFLTAPIWLPIMFIILAIPVWGITEHVSRKEQ